jgi:hypothetical protein
MHPRNSPSLPNRDEGRRPPQQLGVVGLVGWDGTVPQVGVQRPAGQFQQRLPPRRRQVGRGVAPEHHRAVAHHLLGVAVGGVGGVGVAQDGDGVGPQAGRDAHGHQNRPLPAGTGDQAGNAPLHRRRHRRPYPRRVARLHRRQSGPVHRPGVLPGRVVGEVRGRDDDGPPPGEHRQQRVRQRLDRLLIVGAHQDGDNPALGTDPLQEREFYLYRVFPLVGIGVKGDAGVGLNEGPGQVGVHRHQAQRGLPCPLRPDGDGPGEGGLMVGGDDDGDVVLAVGQLAEARRRHRPGEDVSGVGDDEGNGCAVHRPLRLQHPVYGLRQFGRVGGVPGARNGGGADAADGRERGGGWGRWRLRRRGRGGAGRQIQHQHQQTADNPHPLHRHPRFLPHLFFSHKDTKAQSLKYIFILCVLCVFV